MKGGRTPGGRSEQGQCRKAAYGRAAGDETHTGMMILASAMRHSVGRPATGMGGGTKILWSGFARRRLNPPLFYIVNNEIPKHQTMRNLSLMRLTVRRIFVADILSLGMLPFRKSAKEHLTKIAAKTVKICAFT